MGQLASEVRHSSTCGPDLAVGNAVAVQALMGFQNYALMRELGCEKSNTTGLVSREGVWMIWQELIILLLDSTALLRQQLKAHQLSSTFTNSYCSISLVP